MIAIQIPDTKQFMNLLLRSETFDHFLLQEAVIAKDASYVIDGHLNKDFYSDEEIELLGLEGCTALPYAMLRDKCFDLMKGRRMPSTFKFVFLLSPANLSRTLASCHSSFTTADITGVFFNLHYQENVLRLTTGISYRIFSPDKSLDHEWDRLMKLFLSQKEIPFEEL